MKASKKNDARTELTTARRRSVASNSRNAVAESMTHPPVGTCVHNAPRPRRGAYDSIRDGANRIDARKRTRSRRRLDVFHS